MNHNQAFPVLALLIGSVLIFSGCVRSDQSTWKTEALKAVEAAIPQAEKDPTRPLYHFRPPAQ